MLELFVLLAHLDQLGQLIMPLLEQHVYVGPCLGHGVFYADQMVVQADTVDQQYRDNAEKNQNSHIFPFDYMSQRSCGSIVPLNLNYGRISCKQHTAIITVHIQVLIRNAELATVIAFLTN